MSQLLFLIGALFVLLQFGFTVLGFLSLHNLDNAHNLLNVQILMGSEWADKRADGNYVTASDIWSEDYPTIWVLFALSGLLSLGASLLLILGGTLWPEK